MEECTKLSNYLITLLAHGSNGVALTMLASFTASNLPMVFSTKLAERSTNVGQTWTLSTEPIAKLNRLISTQQMAVAFYIKTKFYKSFQ